ncbi:hypothetical protein B6D52_02225 [Candidatus Parcubacteria bacterium 4484_255]|nr:MAG: hypothetical protein B6D52_02225 [Candidatus Parcubacteria bacterium 4484_255]
MNIQNFFYIVASASIILIAIFALALLFIAILIGCRLFKFSKSLANISQKSEEILEKIKNKTKLITFISLIKHITKEFFAKKNKKINGKEKK